MHKMGTHNNFFIQASFTDGWEKPSVQLRDAHLRTSIGFGGIEKLSL